MPSTPRRAYMAPGSRLNVMSLGSLRTASTWASRGRSPTKAERCTMRARASRIWSTSEGERLSLTLGKTVIDLSPSGPTAMTVRPLLPRRTSPWYIGSPRPSTSVSAASSSPTAPT